MSAAVIIVQIVCIVVEATDFNSNVITSSAKEAWSVFVADMDNGIFAV